MRQVAPSEAGRLGAGFDARDSDAALRPFGDLPVVSMDGPNFEAAAGGLDELPTCPAVALRLVDELRRPESLDPTELEAAILRDPAVALKVLRVANSPMFGKPGRISTVAHAVALLDPRVARLVGLSFTLSPNAGRIHGFDYERYWKTSHTTSWAASQVARHFPEVNVDEARLGGLFVDVGRLMLAESLGQRYGDLCRRAEESGEPLEDVERAVLGVDHPSIAAAALAGWHFPSSLVESVRRRRGPCEEDGLDAHVRELSRVLCLSRLLAGLALGGEASRGPLYEAFEMWARVAPETVDALCESAQSYAAGLGSAFGLVEEPPELLKERARRALLEASLSTAQTLSLAARQAEEHERRAEEFRRERDNLQRQVTLDPVLNIGNRRYFDARLTEEYKRSSRAGRPLSLILFDLDHFKSLNDTYGHPLGDEALKASTRTIAQCLRSSDVFSRYGGEEFAVLCPETEFAGAMRLAERMRHCLERLEIYQRGRVVRLTASFGVATVDQPQDLRSTDDLIEAADQSLFEAKRAGRNCVRGAVFSPPEAPRPRGPAHASQTESPSGPAAAEL
jgi:diguanylate cyclase (GGDEF)-like protein